VARAQREEVAPGVLRIATRPSDVAVRRARHVQSLLEAVGVSTRLIEVRTAGDKCKEDQILSASARTFFTHEIETALLRGKADVAVHALPDISTDPSPGLTLAAFLRREDPRDAIILNSLHEATTLAELPRGTRVGSSSVRVRSLLRSLYRDLEVVHLRGDLPTRLQKVDTGQVHATVVPAASLQLLGISQPIAGYLEAPEWLPTPGQGVIALQIREDDHVTRDRVAALDDTATHRQVIAERAVLGSLEGGLQSPVGALVVDDILHAVIADQEGRRILRASRSLSGEEPQLVGVRVANDLRGKGASFMLDEMRRAERIPAPQPD
jgi:hydroxymethylbilane synthase